MYQFIYWLRAIAAMLITNAHYENIYPISIIANGGLLGDVIFFGISGFLLCKVKETFLNWYKHRLWRIYPSVWVITILYLLLGFYHAGNILDFLKLLFYPTYYHFIASILVLYIPFYFIIWLIEKMEWDKSTAIKYIGIFTAAIYFVIYFTCYDYSYYHIDDVYAPMIRFLFFGSMLIGAYFRFKFDTERNHRIILRYTLLAVCLMCYFVSKLMFAKEILPPKFQFVNQLVLLCVLYFLFSCFREMENDLQNIPPALQKIVYWISEHTLEIYLVQYALIPRLNILPFPWNFLLVSAAILMSAGLLHKSIEWLRNSVKVKKRSEYNG